VKIWVILVYFMKILPKMFHHPFSLKNYISVAGKNRKICNKSQRFGLESGRHTAIG
jgi:hypothetical protein